MSSFILITDAHIVAEGELAYGRSDTAAALVSAVSSVNERLVLLDDVDVVIVTGDLTDHGSEEEYERFKSIMSDLRLPYLAVPGNHDRRETMRAAFAGTDWMPASGPIQWRRDLEAFTLIGLDTLLEGSHHGDLSTEGLAFVDEALAELDGQPVVVATHHPWMHTGMRAMDANNLRNGDQLLQRLESYPGTARMVSGHVHRALTTQLGNVTCQVAPAPCHAVHLDHREAVDQTFTFEPGAITLFTWQQGPVRNLVSDVVPLGRIEGPWPFSLS